MNAGKVLSAAMDYTPYGEPNAWRGDVPAKTYTGHYHDAETGMYFAPYRYYMPEAGRWLTRDPLGMVDGPNVYRYVGGAVIENFDPWGLFIRVRCGKQRFSKKESCSLIMKTESFCFWLKITTRVAWRNCVLEKFDVRWWDWVPIHNWQEEL